MKIGDSVQIKSWNHFEKYWEKHGYDFAGPEEIKRDFDKLNGKIVKIINIDSGGHLVVEGSSISWLKNDFEKR